MQDQEDPIAYALAVAEGTEEMPPFIDEERLEAVATYMATRMFATFAQAEEESDQGDEETVDERLSRYIANAIAAAYITGALDVTSEPNPTPEALTLSRKNGSDITININVS